MVAMCGDAAYRHLGRFSQTSVHESSCRPNLAIQLSSEQSKASVLRPFKPVSFDTRARHYPQAGIDR